MKAIVQIWIFISAGLLVLGYFYSSITISTIALITAVLAYRQYKKV
ncbi:hypothetical protein KGR20_03085 [Cytobacillus oceanisediminis]|uniref:Uncharacterized protein n=1 Tax=Niallia alba TaxID=2729105 RepID=A0A7Y0KCU9_9BACI|nr:MULTISPECIES: hypothetical protein [Bacillaceae]MBZ9533242.1 hypothetical protein [Cytobacillus oceanisediminis]MDU1846589.1 hypothetical protein [Niallia nealsonii]NMO79350.1 hypothetical protein [Niallia alba]UTI42661.1 hypothetical protein NKG37_02580 [Niallia sp. RD1]